MLEAQFYAGGGDKKDSPKLAVKALREWIKEEHSICNGFIRLSVKKLLQYTEGNPFAQLLHDGATLANNHKCQAIGIEFIDAEHFQNHSVCLGMVRLSSNHNAVGAKTIRDVMDRVIGMKPEDIVAATMSDLAAKGIAREFGQEGEECDMHQGDKIGRSAVGDLVRTVNKVPVNAFPSGQVLMKKAHDMAVFSATGSD